MFQLLAIYEISSLLKKLRRLTNITSVLFNTTIVSYNYELWLQFNESFYEESYIYIYIYIPLEKVYLIDIIQRL